MSSYTNSQMRAAFLRLCGLATISPLLATAGRLFSGSSMYPKSVLRDPAFYTENGLFVPQFDEEQYDFGNPIIRSNACGFSVLATAMRLMSQLETGFHTNTRIQDIYEALKDKTFDFANKQYPFIFYDYQLYFVGLKKALDKVLSPLGYGGSWFFREPSVVNPTLLMHYDYPNLMNELAGISNKGAFFIAHVVKPRVINGTRYNVGHLVLVSNIRADGSGLFLDPYDGTIQESNFENYCSWLVDPTFPHLGEQPGLLNFLCVMPQAFQNDVGEEPAIPV